MPMDRSAYSGFSETRNLLDFPYGSRGWGRGGRFHAFFRFSDLSGFWDPGIFLISVIRSFVAEVRTSLRGVPVGLLSVRYFGSSDGVVLRIDEVKKKFILAANDVAPSARSWWRSVPTRRYYSRKSRSARGAMFRSY